MTKKNAYMAVSLFIIFCFLPLSSVWASGADEASLVPIAGAAWSPAVNLSKGNIGSPMRPDVSADGTRVVYLNDPWNITDTAKEIKIVEYSAGKWGTPQVLANNAINDSESFVWLPRFTYPVISGNGNVIAYLCFTSGDPTAQTGQVCIIDRTGGVWGAPYVLPTGLENIHYWMDISYDGNAVAYTDYPLNIFAASPTAYVSTRTDGVWGSPVAVSGASVGAALVSLNADATKLAWAQGYGLMYAEQVGGVWSAPELLIPEEVTATYYQILDYSRILPDGSAIFYRKTKVEDVGGTSTETEQNHYVIRRAEGGWAGPEKVNSTVLVPSIYLDAPAAINGTGTRAIYHRGYVTDDVMYGSHLESADYKNGQWTISAVTNTSNGFDRDPKLTPDGLNLVYGGPSPDGSGATAILMRQTGLALTVGKLGAGAGIVTSDPAGINCGGEGTVCAHRYAQGAVITLTAIAQPSSTFTQWTGCKVKPLHPEICTLTMNGNATVLATFISYTLAVQKQGAGAGTVTSDPAGINCTGTGTGCSAKYAKGTEITLTAAADAKSTFAGWTNCKAGSSSNVCTLTMNAGRAVTAAFSTFTLLVKKQGAGAGTVTSDPAGINCTGTGPGCSDHFAKGTAITLTATADGTSKFGGWVGPACKADTLNPTKCTLTMSAGKTVTAWFKKK